MSADEILPLFIYSSLCGQAPPFLADDIHLISEGPRRRLRSSTDRSCAVPRTHNTFGDRSFADAGPRLWNSLPVHLRDEDISYSSFRRELKIAIISGLFWLKVTHIQMRSTSISGGLTSDLIDLTPLLNLGWDGESVSWIARWYISWLIAWNIDVLPRSGLCKVASHVSDVTQRNVLKAATCIHKIADWHASSDFGISTVLKFPILNFFSIRASWIIISTFTVFVSYFEINDKIFID